MKKISIFLMLLCITLGANAQLLWKVSGKDLSKPSYILGTHHLAPLSIVDSIANFKETLHSVDQVYGEVITKEMQNPTNIQKMQQTIILPGDTTLHTLLTEARYDSVAATVKQLVGVELKMMDKMKPAFITSQLSVILAMKNIKGFNPQQQLDGWVQTEAEKQGKKIGGLETMDYQMGVLFDSQSLMRQAELLYGCVKYIDKTEDQAIRMTNAYMKQDLKELNAIINEKMGNCYDALPEEEDKLLYNRNSNWSKLMPSIMKANSTLFVVGAGHLLGERGVLNLLKQQGYTVKAVK